MIPLRDDNPTFHTSVGTYTLIGLNIFTWIFLQNLGFGQAHLQSVVSWGLIPGELLGRIPAGTEVTLGRGIRLVFDGQPNYFSLLTHVFMHGGWFHLIGNMWFLWVFGDNVEDVLGTPRFLLFYLLCGISAAGAQILSAPGSAVPMVGASGAIGGVMGAYAVLFPRAPVHVLVFLGFFVTRVVVPAFLMLGYWFILQILGGIPAVGAQSGGVAFWAHIGGFAGGIILLKLLCPAGRIEECRTRHGRVERISRVRW